MSVKSIQAIRGMNDILPARTGVWQHVEASLREIVESYGYREIRFPVVEKTALFIRSIGEVTDIVEKEMYTFADRNSDSLTLRPEGTASCVRALLQHGLLNEGAQRLWYIGPMFRRERPQKGRYRQFHQIGAEVFGLHGPDIDAEMIMMNSRFWKRLGLDDIRLYINSLGNAASRDAYRKTLTDYLRAHRQVLDEDARRRLDSNPLRILDSKNPAMRELINNAPRLSDSLDEHSKAHFAGLRERLDAFGLGYSVDETLVRGLDYYSDTVFEWVTDRLGSQGTVCGGGRYDGLVSGLGGKSTPAVGFAMGLERLVEMLSADAHQQTVDVYLIGVGEGVQVAMQALAESLREQVSDMALLVHCGGGSLKSQLRKADRSGARFALVLGEREHAKGEVAVKNLRQENAPQEVIAHNKLADFLRRVRADKIVE